MFAFIDNCDPINTTGMSHPKVTLAVFDGTQNPSLLQLTEGDDKYRMNKHCVVSYDVVIFCQELHSSCSLSSFQLAQSVQDMYVVK